MPEIILHHYPMSPASEKVRAILGYKQMAWKSVHIPPVMPKPDVVALTGGYRRTPFLQIGADVFCDTALICNVLEHYKPDPGLCLPEERGASLILSEWADTTLFRVSMAYNFQPAGAALLLGSMPADVAKAFVEDRKAMAAGTIRLRPGDATSAYRSYLRRLSSMLDWQPFLIGKRPCLADFAVYQCIWFTRTQVPALAGILDATPAVKAWADRMAAFGQGMPHAISATEAIAISARSTCQEPGKLLKGEPFQDDHGISLGSQVTLAAESFGTETTTGELIAATRTHYSLRRQDARAGTVHVHFPRVGYVLRKAD